MGRHHIATLVHQFPYHIFFMICIFNYVTCIILSSVVMYMRTLKIKYISMLSAESYDSNVYIPVEIYVVESGKYIRDNWETSGLLHYKISVITGKTPDSFIIRYP